MMLKETNTFFGVLVNRFIAVKMMIDILNCNTYKYSMRVNT
jgi:hypothetical protein